MDDIHSPTVVPSGPTSRPSANGTSGPKTLQELIARKENLEAELKALGSVLDSHGVNMNTSLTSFDGYPRANIDVAQIRTTRAQIIRLKNDHKSLMKEVEEAVHAGFAASKTNSIVSSDTGETSTSTTAATNPPVPNGISAGVPFAKVNAVANGSPADVAGMKPGDQVTAFGYANWTNHERLTRIAQIVQQNENRPVLVKILRDTSPMELSLTPRRDWGGRGTLGCHLLPV